MLPLEALLASLSRRLRSSSVVLCQLPSRNILYEAPADGRPTWLQGVVRMTGGAEARAVASAPLGTAVYWESPVPAQRVRPQPI